jgi:hypothetical protein
MRALTLLAGISLYAGGILAPFWTQIALFFAGAFFIQLFLFICLKNYNQSE